MHRPADGIFHRIGDGSADGFDAALAGPFDAEGADEILQPDLLAKFVSVPIYNEVGPAEREIASASCSGEWMTLIEDLDLATYCGRIGNLYIRAGLSRLSPFVMQCKGGWRGTFRSRIVDVPKFPYRTIALKLDAAHLGAHEIPR